MNINRGTIKARLIIAMMFVLIVATYNVHAAPLIGKPTTVSRIQTVGETGSVNAGPTIGTINNLVVFIHFSDQAEFTAATSGYNSIFNSTIAGYNSLRNYYTEVSYNALTINSTFYPTPGTTVISYTATHLRSYYSPYDAITNPGGYTGGDSGTARAGREHILLRDALAYVNGLGQFPYGDSLDSNDDLLVDSVTFIIRGGPDGESNLLSNHSWTLAGPDYYIDGIRVGNYSFHLETSVDTSVLAHEMFHVLGAPDLNHISGMGNTNLTPVGGWDIMGLNSHPAQHMGCYMKHKYGKWIASIPQLTVPGSYSLNPLTSPTNNCYRVGSPYSGNEYYILEYRKWGTSIFEASLPAEGLLVYRINTTQTGNNDGPPDEVYIYRPDGTTTMDGIIDNAYYSSDAGRTAINDSTNPASFLSNGSAGGLNICNISTPGTTISFTYGSCSGATRPSSFGKSSPGNGITNLSTSPTLDWADATNAISYEYCYDQISDDTCTGTWTYTGSTSQVTVSGLSGYTTYEWQVRANNIAGSTVANSGDAWVFTTGIEGDSYEDDDVYADSNPIVSNVPQVHSILPIGDKDWVTFTLTYPASSIRLEISGSHPGTDDTYMVLYQSDGFTEITNNDDINFPSNLYSRISTDCRTVTLHEGNYYASVEELDNDNTITEYQLDFSTAPCIDYTNFIYLPIILKSGSSSSTLGNTNPYNDAIPLFSMFGLFP